MALISVWQAPSADTTVKVCQTFLTNVEREDQAFKVLHGVLFSQKHTLHTLVLLVFREIGAK